ncbi:hypothetical protein Pst134EA_019304 [Puccinia striiformis f. sp. tritici]|uniref:hypothetical protein n=1 Tax=Puccinia striiformis f. sp. tritici TaxID=168172 RepID=UPI0020083A8F|nr:hypothetical protein Pst134EA_019304 [Puccinia striiformis f. sp. tritici]KAH9459149.1 hypothetical protein Pst134EA_019304 [Puccinia striiformis f. sp. tritici]
MTSMWILVVCFLTYLSTVRATFRLTGSYNSPRRLVNLGRHHSKPVKPVPAPIANRDWSAGQPNSSPFGSDTF